MDVGKPKRVVRVEPLREPVPPKRQPRRRSKPVRTN
jgi:hypothetical protein